MSSSAKNLAVQPRPEYKMKIVKGPNKGDEFQILSPIITIGRSSENDIVLANDAKCSRKHARLTVHPQGVQLESLSEKNLIFVNGKSIPKVELINNSKFKLGNTTLEFVVQINLPAEVTKSKSAKNSSLDNYSGNMPDEAIGRTSRHEHAPAIEAKKFPTRFVVYGLVGLIFVWLLTDSGGKKDDLFDIRTDDTITQDIDSSLDLVEAERKIKVQRGFKKPEYREAQSHYIRGFRDYKKGQFERAVSSFEACLSLFPSHQLCQRYKKLSEKKFQELIQYHMVAGKRFLDQGMYSSCKSSFKNAMIMVRNRQSKVYKEANANFMLCESRLEARY